MAKDSRNRLVVLAEEQTLLSRERTMQQYMTTGLAFIALAIVIIQLFFEPIYVVIGGILIIIGFWQIWMAYNRFKKYRTIVRKIRKKEKRLGLEVGE